MDLLDRLTTAVILTDTGRRIAYLNTACEQLLGSSRKQLTGKQLTDYLQHQDNFPDPGTLEASAITERAITLTLPHSRQTITADISLTATPAGTLIEIQPQTRAHLISRAKELEQQAEHNRLIIKNLAHEIRNPLAGIKGAAQRLAETDGEKQQQYLALITGQVDRLNNLLIQLGGENQPRLQNENIHRTIEDSLAIFSQDPANRTITIAKHYDPSLPDTAHDPQQIQQVLLNLLSNASKACDRQGEITITTGTVRQYTIGSTKHKTALTIAVTDTGCGIAEEHHTAIFQPMNSRFTHGSGLGLSIAQNIIRRHEGAIELASQPGKTTFTLILPLQRTAP